MNHYDGDLPTGSPPPAGPVNGPRSIDEWDRTNAERKAQRRRRQRRLDAIVIVLSIAILLGGFFVFKAVTGEGEIGPTRLADPAPSPVAPTLPTSQGITQAQLDRLGASIGARYQNGDTEVAQALLDNFMQVHPECVAAVIAGGEGKMRDVLAESEEAAAYLKSTAPNPNTYTTVITTKDDGVVKAAVLGVSCE